MCPGWPGIHYVVHTGLRLARQPLPVSSVLGLMVYAAMSGMPDVFMEMRKVTSKIITHY